MGWGKPPSVVGRFLCGVGADRKSGVVGDGCSAGASGLFAVCAAANGTAKPPSGHVGSGHGIECAVRVFERNRRGGRRSVWPGSGKQRAAGFLAGGGFVSVSVVFVSVDGFRKKSIKKAKGEPRRFPFIFSGLK